MAHLKSHQQLTEELKEAKKLVVIGGRYSHYKHPENTYKIVGLGIQESTDKICVFYHPEYMDDKITFVRDLDNWLETPEMNGTKVERFKLIVS